MAQQSIVGEKVGMTQTWVDDKVVPVTVLRVEPMRIVQIKTNERDGYTALQVTYGHRKANKLTKPALGHFEKAGVEPGKRLVELRLDSVDGFEVGQELTVEQIPAGTMVEVLLLVEFVVVGVPGLTAVAVVARFEQAVEVGHLADPEPRGVAPGADGFS